MANEAEREATNAEIREALCSIRNMRPGSSHRVSANENSAVTAVSGIGFNHRNRDLQPLNERLFQRKLADMKSELEIVGSGKVKESDRDNLWLAQLGVELAMESLRLASMDQHPGMQAREVGEAADTKTLEFYTEAARNTEYEVERLEYVESRVKDLVNNMRAGRL